MFRNMSQNSSRPEGFYFYTPPSEQRRITVCGVIDEETQELNIGYTVCSPKDSFTRKRGRTIARGRAKANPIVKVNITNLNEPLGRVFFKTATELAGGLLSNYSEKRHAHRDSIIKPSENGRN